MHFIRNVLAHVPKAQVEMVAAVFRTIFTQPDLASMTKTWDKVRDEPTARYRAIGAISFGAYLAVHAKNHADGPPQPRSRSATPNPTTPRDSHVGAAQEVGNGCKAPLTRGMRGVGIYAMDRETRQFIAQHL